MKTPINHIGTWMSGAAIVVGLFAGLSAAQAAPHAKITAARANAIVLRRYPGKLTAKTTLENEEGQWQYGVMVMSGHKLREVMVDANTGKIASVEITNAAKERTEMQQEAAAHAKANHKMPAAKEKDEKDSDDEKGGKEEKGEKD